MSDPLLTFVLLACFFAAMAAALFFKTVDRGFARAARTPIAAGVVAGAVILALNRIASLQSPLIGVLMTFAAVWVRHTGEESEAADGMILGALTGASAAIPLAIFAGSNELRSFSQLVLSASVAGYGITYAAFHVGDRTRQIAIDAITAVAAVLAAYAPAAINRRLLSDGEVAIFTTAAIPLLALIIVFKQWPDLRAELAHEAALGFMNDADVATTAHPLRRLGRGGWTDGHAHREFVRLASRIALRKRQQRNRTDETARLYQLEIIKLRMQLQEMTRIGRVVNAEVDDLGTAGEPSAKMRT